MATIAEIEKLTKEYADSRGRIASTLMKLEDMIETLKRQYMPGIRAQVRITKGREAALRVAIDDSKELFKRPKTVVFSGLRIGYAKGRGKIEWDDDDKVVRLIEKFFSDQAEILIKTTREPIKKALNALTAAELKKLGITVEETGDVIVIKPVDSQVAKIVDRMLGEKDEAEGEAA